MIFNFLETDYYKKSIDAIYHFEQNTVKDSFKMDLKKDKIFKLLINFFMKDIKDFEKIAISFIIFHEKVEKAKKYYDTLKSIHDFFDIIFPKRKSCWFN